MIVLLNEVDDWGLILSPVVFGLSDVAFQLYVDAISLARFIVAVPPLQIDAAGLLVILGAGFTVIVTV